MVVLARYSEVIQLLSRQKCFSCFSEKTGKLAKILENIHAPFLKDYDYLQKKQSFNKCKQCTKLDGQPLSPNKAPIEPEKELDRPFTWREIIERRVAAKTRRFASSSKGQGIVETVDVYSATLVPIIWASLANKLGDYERPLLSGENTQFLSSALFTAQVFRTLGLVVLGTAGIMCPHFRNLAAQTADLASVYSHHQDAQVRRSVLALLAMVISSSEGKQFVLEIFLNKNSLFEELKAIFEKDPDTENRRLFSSLYQLVSASALVQMGHLLSE
ncbi:unnamed protein product [Allacma fusca]|uniref:Uncharacterized protein n=1 Tax=Allacma fusca TaxID=39272 RepID=A0A8J2JJZ1_9HEXA|nr:unnamed protein product [Allacma fusca]